MTSLALNTRFTCDIHKLYLFGRYVVTHSEHSECLALTDLASRKRVCPRIFIKQKL